MIHQENLMINRNVWCEREDKEASRMATLWFNKHGQGWYHLSRKGNTGREDFEGKMMGSV